MTQAKTKKKTNCNKNEDMSRTCVLHNKTFYTKKKTLLLSDQTREEQVHFIIGTFYYCYKILQVRNHSSMYFTS